MSVWVKPRSHTHTEHELRFPTHYHISYRCGLSLSPILYRCILKLLCPVSRPITTLDCVLLNDNNPALVARSGPEINSPACLSALHGPPHNTRCCFSIQRFYLSSIVLHWDPQERLRYNKILNRTVPCDLVGDFNSSHPGMPRDPIKPHKYINIKYIKYILTQLSIRQLLKYIFNHISQLHVSARPSGTIFRVNFLKRFYVQLTILVNK